jgi:hypothetical protein
MRWTSHKKAARRFRDKKYRPRKTREEFQFPFEPEHPPIDASDLTQKQFEAVHFSLQGQNFHDIARGKGISRTALHGSRFKGLKKLKETVQCQLKSRE